MSDNPTESTISEEMEPGYSKVFFIRGFTVTSTPDGLGLVIEAPAGKVIDLLSPQFGLSPDGKRIEVRCK
jgi:hypothetical protein